MLVEDRGPGHAGVAAAPETARRRPEEEDVRVPPDAGGGADAVPVRSDRPPAEPAEVCGVRRLGGGGRGQEDQSRCREEETETDAHGPGR